MATNTSWQLKLRNEQLYQQLPLVSTKVAERRMRLAGHCVRHNDEVASSLVLWQPTEGRASRGRRTADFIDNLKRDTQLENVEEIRTVMKDREMWKKYVSGARMRVRPR